MLRTGASGGPVAWGRGPQAGGGHPQRFTDNPLARVPRRHLPSAVSACLRPLPFPRCGLSSESNGSLQLRDARPAGCHCCRPARPPACRCTGGRVSRWPAVPCRGAFSRLRVSRKLKIGGERKRMPLTEYLFPDGIFPDIPACIAGWLPLLHCGRELASKH